MNRTIKPFRITIILDDAKPVAQVESMERITEDDGTLITARALPAESLTFPLGDEIIGAVSTTALARVTELEATIKSDKEAADALLEATKADAASKIAEVTAAKDEAVKAFADKQAYQDAMVAKVTAVLQSGDTKQYEALALEFLTPEQEKIRAEKLAQFEALKAELGI